MAFFEWKENFNIGVAEIDRQHRGFLEYLNELHDLTAAERNAPVGKDVIDRLKKYADMHFEYEERLFEVIGYTEAESQIRQHNFFRMRLLELEEDLSTGDVEKLNAVLAFLRDWLLTHVLEADLKYVPFVDTMMNRS